MNTTQTVSLDLEDLAILYQKVKDGEYKNISAYIKKAIREKLEREGF